MTRSPITRRPWPKPTRSSPASPSPRSCEGTRPAQRPLRAGKQTGQAMMIAALPESCQPPALRGGQRPGEVENLPARGGDEDRQPLLSTRQRRVEPAAIVGNSLHPADDAVVEVTGNGRPMVPGVTPDKRVEAAVTGVQDPGSIPGRSIGFRRCGTFAGVVAGQLLVCNPTSRRRGRTTRLSFFS